MRKRMKRQYLIFLIVPALVLAGTAFAASSPSRAKTLAELALYKGADRQQILEEGARKEGKFTYYTTQTQTLRPLLDAFRKKYPFIEVEVWRSDATKLISRIFEEHKAGAHIFDVCDPPQSGELLFEAGGLLQPFHSPNLGQIREAAIKRAPQEGVYAAAYRESLYSLGYNTRLIGRAELPKTNHDLLLPKWQGKMAVVAGENGVTWLGTLYEAYGEEFVQKIAGQQIVVQMVSTRALADMIINGEYALSPTILDAHMSASKKKGAPVDWVALEPVHVNVVYMVLSRYAKHPHAALLFTDFQLSPEMGELYRDTGYAPTRKDIGGVKNYRKNYGPLSLEEQRKWKQLFDKMVLKKH